MATISYNFTNKIYSEDCRLLIDGIDAPRDTDAFGQPIQPTIEPGQTITIVPPEGLAIATMELFSIFGYVVRWDIAEDGSSADRAFDFADDDLKEIPNLVLEDAGVPDVVGGASRNYLVTPEILEQVNDARYLYSFGGSQDSINVDYGVFILGVIQLPFTIPPDNISGDAFVRLGDRVLDVSAPLISTDRLLLPMGDIEVPSVYGDSRDYNGVVYTLHLPYAESITVEPEYVVGEVLRIEYLVDLYTGEVVVRLKSSRVNFNTFYSSRFTLGVNVPNGTTTLTNANVTNSNIGFVGDNGITTPYVEVVDSASFLNETLLSAKIEDEGVLGGFGGYVEVRNLELVVNCDSDNMDKIRAALEGGVFINV